MKVVKCDIQNSSESDRIVMQVLHYTLTGVCVGLLM